MDVGRGGSVGWEETEKRGVIEDPFKDGNNVARGVSAAGWAKIEFELVRARVLLEMQAYDLLLEPYNVWSDQEGSGDVAGRRGVVQGLQRRV